MRESPINRTKLFIEFQTMNNIVCYFFLFFLLKIFFSQSIKIKWIMNISDQYKQRYFISMSFWAHLFHFENGTEWTANIVMIREMRVLLLVWAILPILIGKRWWFKKNILNNKIAYISFWMSFLDFQRVVIRNRLIGASPSIVLLLSLKRFFSEVILFIKKES